MKIPKYVKGQGAVEYLLLFIIIVLIVLIIIKLFGPAINNLIRNYLGNVS